MHEKKCARAPRAVYQSVVGACVANQIANLRVCLDSQPLGYANGGYDHQCQLQKLFACMINMRKFLTVLTGYRAGRKNFLSTFI